MKGKRKVFEQARIVKERTGGYGIRYKMDGGFGRAEGEPIVDIIVYTPACDNLTLKIAQEYLAQLSSKYREKYGSRMKL